MKIFTYVAIICALHYSNHLIYVNSQHKYLKTVFWPITSIQYMVLIPLLLCNQAWTFRAGKSCSFTQFLNSAEEKAGLGLITQENTDPGLFPSLWWAL